VNRRQLRFAYFKFSHLFLFYFAALYFVFAAPFCSIFGPFSASPHYTPTSCQAAATCAPLILKFRARSLFYCAFCVLFYFRCAFYVFHSVYCALIDFTTFRTYSPLPLIYFSSPTSFLGPTPYASALELAPHRLVIARHISSSPYPRSTPDIPRTSSPSPDRSRCARMTEDSHNLSKEEMMSMAHSYTRKTQYTTHKASAIHPVLVAAISDSISDQRFRVAISDFA